MLLLCFLWSCSWKSHIDSYNFNFYYNPKEFNTYKKDSLLPERIDSLIIIDGDTLKGLNKKPTNHYISIWYDSKGRKFRSGLFFKTYMSKSDTTFYKDGTIRSIQTGELCYICKNWPYHSWKTIYYDRKGRPLIRTYMEIDSAYKQYYNKEGKLLEQRYKWLNFVTLNE